MMLVGNGGHATDIWATIKNQSAWKRVAHHDDWDGDPQTILAINDPQIRAQVAKKLDVRDRSWVHPHAFIGPRCSWGHGTHIYHAASLTRTRMGHHCQISPGATICGDVILGDRVFVGANATVVNLSVVPDDTFIKAGTVWSQR